MKLKERIRLFVLITLAACVATSSLNAQKGGFKQNTMDRNYNPATVETVSGTITAVSNINTWGIHIKVKTGSGITGVHLGPDWFVKKKVTLASGDQVTVTGSKVRIDGEDVIIAKTITKGDINVQLRNDNGVPLWAGSGKGKYR